MRTINVSRMATALLASLLALGCDDGASSGTARVSLALTDAQGDVAYAWIEIGEIYLQGGESGRVTLVSESDAAGLGLIELTELAGTTLDLVSDVEITAGNYGQLRVVILGAVVETTDGEVYTFNASHPEGTEDTGPLTCPSCTNTGIKVLLHGQVADLEAGAHLIILDFDVADSFGHATGQPGWVMHPVIHAAELGFTGSVSGTVTLASGVTIPECPLGTPRDLTSFVPQAVAQTLTDDSGPITVTTAVLVDGTFSFPYLHPDAYDFGYISSVDFGTSTLTFVATAPGIVDVTSGSAHEVEYTITSATCS